MYVESGRNETISAYKRGLENLRSMATLFKHFLEYIAFVDMHEVKQ